MHAQTGRRSRRDTVRERAELNVPARLHAGGRPTRLQDFQRADGPKNYFAVLLHQILSLEGPMDENSRNKSATFGDVPAPSFVRPPGRLLARQATANSFGKLRMVTRARVGASGRTNGRRGSLVSAVSFFGSSGVRPRTLAGSNLLAQRIRRTHKLTVREQIFLILEEPTSSLLARAASFVVSAVTIIATIFSTLETCQIMEAWGNAPFEVARYVRGSLPLHIPCLVSESCTGAPRPLPNILTRPRPLASTAHPARCHPPRPPFAGLRLLLRGRSLRACHVLHSLPPRLLRPLHLARRPHPSSLSHPSCIW